MGSGKDKHFPFLKEAVGRNFVCVCGQLIDLRAYPLMSVKERNIQRKRYTAP